MRPEFSEVGSLDDLPSSRSRRPCHAPSLSRERSGSLTCFPRAWATASARRASGTTDSARRNTSTCGAQILGYDFWPVDRGKFLQADGSRPCGGG